MAEGRLTVELLERLKTGWARQRAPIVGHLRPGLSRHRIEQATAPLGLSLPVEARTWWEWHDGVDVRLGTRMELGPSLPFLPLANAIELCRLMREQAAQVWEEQADYRWRRTWFPITDRLGVIRCDCSVGDEAPTPIYWADSHDHDANGLTSPKVESFATMVAWWIDALDTGAWRYNADLNRWERHEELLPRERQRSDIV